jgi:hypothetical protein
MEAKFFSYKVPGIILETVNENLKLSGTFNRKELLDQLKEILKAQNFKVDATTLDYKVADDQIFITGMAVEDKEAKGIGFMTGR